MPMRTPLRPRGHPARDEERRRQHRARRVHHHLGHPHDVEAPRLRGVDEIEHLAGMHRADRRRGGVCSRKIPKSMAPPFRGRNRTADERGETIRAPAGGTGARGRRYFLRRSSSSGADVGERRDQGQRRLLQPRAHAADEPVLPDRREHHPVVEDALDLVQHLLALLPVELPRLALEEILHLRQHAVGVGAVLRRDALDARGRVAARALRAEHDALAASCRPTRVRNAARSSVRTRVRMPTACEVVRDRLRHRRSTAGSA